MNIRIATYNTNNLFERAAVMQLSGFSADAAEVLADVSELNGILEKPSYKAQDKQRIKEILEKYNFHKQNKNPWFTINEIRKRLFSVKQDGSGVTVVAAGRGSWDGFVELIREQVNEAATQNTGRVIKAVNADVMCVVEVEDRRTLKRFNDGILKSLNTDFKHSMLIDGNDDRGIDVGILSQFEIRSIRSHVDDPPKNNPAGRVFSRDCAEYEVLLPGGQSLWLLCNHFKSKGFGTQQANDKKRTAQADRVADILKRFNLKADFVVVAGDLNDTPDSQPLSGLLSTPNLIDVLSSNLLVGPRFTYEDGHDQIDYLLVSKALGDKLKKVQIERRGIFSQNNFNGQFPHFPEVTGKVDQASDHAAVSAEFKL
jgi:endonuclease/exonuclease/phosphatase family metal-dependent hydrolase